MGCGHERLDGTGSSDGRAESPGPQQPRRLVRLRPPRGRDVRWLRPGDWRRDRSARRLVGVGRHHRHLDGDDAPGRQAPAAPEPHPTLRLAGGDALVFGGSVQADSTCSPQEIWGASRAPRRGRQVRLLGGERLDLRPASASQRLLRRRPARDCKSCNVPAWQACASTFRRVGRRRTSSDQACDATSSAEAPRPAVRRVQRVRERSLPTRLLQLEAARRARSAAWRRAALRARSSRRATRIRRRPPASPPAQGGMRRGGHLQQQPKGNGKPCRRPAVRADSASTASAA
jgi:hypothetical protein